MYHQINATDMFRERQLALLEEAESRRLAQRVGVARRTEEARGTTGVAAVALGFLAALLLASLLVVAAGPAEAAYPGANGKIAFASNRTTGEGVDNPTGDSEIFTMNKDGTDITQLTHNTTYDTNPSFSAGADAIAFMSERDGNAEIYVMSPGGGPPIRLTNNTTHENNPTISPDGTKVAYESLRLGSFEIILLDVASGFEFELTTNPAHDLLPAFSPDGTKIAFTS